jgi:hypothetical protein
MGDERLRRMSRGRAEPAPAPERESADLRRISKHSGMTAAALNVALTTPHAENADIRLYPRTAARNQCLHSEPEGQ